MSLLKFIEAKIEEKAPGTQLSIAHIELINTLHTLLGEFEARLTNAENGMGALHQHVEAVVKEAIAEPLAALKELTNVLHAHAAAAPATVTIAAETPALTTVQEHALSTAEVAALSAVATPIAEPVAPAAAAPTIAAPAETPTNPPPVVSGDTQPGAASILN